MISKNRAKRKLRVKSRLRGMTGCPRISVFRSNIHIYAQIIDDEEAKTLVSASDLELKKEDKKGTKTEIAQQVGLLLATKAVKKKIKKVVFDREGYKFHGRVKALADSARKGGLLF
ncbi:MAG: 50S ribosomal protein L18 [Candidatus Berkelbacteria bacterium]|nr:50S ribosomal protein L18 [Candidatus Berkelbacteria bacterium]